MKAIFSLSLKELYIKTLSGMAALALIYILLALFLLAIIFIHYCIPQSITKLRVIESEEECNRNKCHWFLLVKLLNPVCRLLSSFVCGKLDMRLSPPLFF